MRYFALATDYDGTLAHDGVVSEETVAALERLRATGRRLILVTGRELPDLLRAFPRANLFDRVVAENGALLYCPDTREEQSLAEAPPAALVAALREQGVAPLAVGRVIVATWHPNETVVLKTIRDLGLEHQVIFNKGAVMVLPSGVNKATGLVAALAELGLSPHNAVGVGDAENDHAFLKVCECSAAVANALPAVKDTADVVARHDHGAGVAELIDQMIANDLSHLKTLSRHRVLVAETAEKEAFGIDPAGAGVMVCGTSGSGKSTLTTAILERLADTGYQSLIVDPEGDYTNLEFAAHIGNPEHAPLPSEVNDALRDTKRSVVVNLLGVPLADRPGFFAQLLPHIQEVKARTGRPHWLVIDEAHHMLPAGDAAASVAAQLPDRGLMFVTVHAGTVEPAALANVGTVLVIGDRPVATIDEFCKATKANQPKCPAVGGDKLPTGDALAWHRGEAEAAIVHTHQPRTERKRHLRKYAAGNLGAERSFYFRGPKGKLNLKAPNLFQFLQLADGVDDETWEYHRKRGHFSKWIRDQIKDEQLADDLVKVESDKRAGPKDTRAAVRAAIEARYTLPADEPSGLIE